ncbi:glycerate dehydrogenase [Streptoalloteichus tenebrarius]|uniref:Glycerate dehydrogenase n=1 Tax=Streptoalloteichus tenebrarius (strain ATCC 17920 / DSM 40477 / JCM 4838 / CBS 697.72 / NBRC 16177 / NCIMB 11028 / NRRL B-12390 / A12253. 1 / ISP 5477) TaxID=1933 RepID=A0ABT1HSN9_STRSD|nr:NAD(P)-dependent oxidoreductase [Streptoalloteichus tenebrarius]MCP2258538.1 glycerate dehydrogenase [Streptoalloteichus tenebrarius]BFF04096.1 hypothetical protein GCM10020241_57710 [Streptoalloteichus tenebrarius]
MTERRTRPAALLLLDPTDVPATVTPRIERLVEPTWWPEDLADLPAHRTPEDTSVLVTGHQELGAAALSRFPRLRLVLATGTATDHIDLDYCREHDVVVRNNTGYSGATVAEHVFALLLARSRRLASAEATARFGGPKEHTLGFDLAGRTMGIVGLGDVGGRVARLALGFDMRVLFANSNPRHVPFASQVDLDRLLRESDVVVLTVPLTPRTRHLLDADRFRTMRGNAVVVNVSADELIDPDALASALCEGTIAGAALDVTGSTAPYLDLPNLTITSRHGWYTAECRHRRAVRWINTLAECLDHLDRAVTVAERRWSATARDTAGPSAAAFEEGHRLSGDSEWSNAVRPFVLLTPSSNVFPPAVLPDHEGGKSVPPHTPRGT